MGFRYVASGPMVRSSYKAGEFFMQNMIKADGGAVEATVAGNGDDVAVATRHPCRVNMGRAGRSGHGARRTIPLPTPVALGRVALALAHRPAEKVCDYERTSHAI
eukprot:scaffold136168_cov32-Tisochrysis_lutea.AAC.4